MRAALLALLTTGCANAYVNSGALAASTLAVACDWGQTRWAASRGWTGGRWEGNPIMGPRPSASTVDMYFAFTALMNAAIWLVAPERARVVMPSAVVIAEGEQIRENMTRTPLCGL